MIPLVASVLAASLVGSPHCAGMCGGFVCFYSGQPGERRRWLAHAAYNGGRLVSYLLLGIAAGAVGAGLERAGATVGIGRAAAVAAGIVMVAWGGMRLLETWGVRLGVHGPARPVRAAFAAALRALHAQPPALRALAIGLLTALLPCGWLYVFVATAAGTGSPAGGAAVMAAFWLGTVPVMAGLGIAAQAALGPIARRLPALTAGALVILGLLTVTGKMGASLGAGHSHGVGHGSRTHVGDPGHGRADHAGSAHGAPASPGRSGGAPDRTRPPEAVPDSAGRPGRIASLRSSPSASPSTTRPAEPAAVPASGSSARPGAGTGHVGH